MRIAIDVGLLVLVGFAALPACGSRGALPAGGTGGSTGVSSGGTVVVANGGSGGATVRPATGGAGGVSPAGGVGGLGGGISAGGAGGSTGAQVAGAPCAVEGQQSECATGRPLMSACGSCMGHWLVCQTGRWIEVHCDPPPPEPPLDASVDGRDAGDARDAADATEVSPLVDAGAIDTGAIDTRAIDSGNPIDGTGILRGYLVYANELMAFEACGTATLAWANLQGWEAGRELLPTLGPFCVTTDAGRAPCPGTIYVELAGTIVSGGSYGHMGKFTSQLTVGRFLAASLTGPDDCPFLTSVYPS